MCATIYVFAFHGSLFRLRVSVYVIPSTTCVCVCICVCAFACDVCVWVQCVMAVRYTCDFLGRAELRQPHRVRYAWLWGGPVSVWRGARGMWC